MNFDPFNYTYALVTSTTYGNWLPGDRRGYVQEHNQFGTPFDAPDETLHDVARSQMKGSAVFFSKEQAEIVLRRWLEVVGEIDGRLSAVALMSNHFHLTLCLPGRPTDETKSKLLKFLKGRASRALNKRFGKQTWWTDSGSVRYSFEESAFLARIEYVKNQPNALVIWPSEEYKDLYQL